MLLFSFVTAETSHTVEQKIERSVFVFSIQDVTELATLNSPRLCKPTFEECRTSSVWISAAKSSFKRRDDPLW